MKPITKKRTPRKLIVKEVSLTESEFQNIKSCLYIIIITVTLVSGYIDYQNWINPLGLNIEKNPKQHNGALEFVPPTQFESAITLPNGRPIIIGDDKRITSDLSDVELEVFEELRQMDELSEEEFREKLQSELQ